MRSGPLRSKASSAVTCAQPAPSSPISASCGSSTSSKKTSLKCCVAGQVADGAHGDAGQRQVDDHLRQALVPVFRRAAGAHQRDHVVRAMRVGGPQLLALEHASRRRVRVARVRSPARSEPLCGSLMPMQKKTSAAQIFGRKKSLLRRRAVLQDQRAALPIGDPVRRHRRAAAQQLFDQHEAVEGVLAAAAVLLRAASCRPSRVPASARLNSASKPIHERASRSVGRPRSASSRKARTAGRRACGRLREWR